MPAPLAEPHRKVLFNAPVSVLDRLERVRKERSLADVLREALTRWVESAEIRTKM